VVREEVIYKSWGTVISLYAVFVAYLLSSVKMFMRRLTRGVYTGGSPAVFIRGFCTGNYALENYALGDYTLGVCT
jgi:hypothetical protein